MPTPEDEIRSIQQQISQAKSREARAAVEKDNALAKRNAAAKTLKEEFGISTNSEAKDKLIELESELAQVIADTKAALNQSGASV